MDKYDEFLLALRELTLKYGVAIHGCGISPSDEQEIYYWMRENDVELSSDYHEIGMNEGIAIVDRLIQLELEDV